MLSDIRSAVRTTRRSPTFSAAVVVCLALGIGVTTTMFTIANALLLRPLPFADPGGILVVRERREDGPGGARGSLSLPAYVDYREAVRAFAGFGVYRGQSYNLASGRGEAEYVEGSAVSPSLFPLLGVAPVVGRGFLPDEERPGRDKVALLGWDVWQRRFGGDAAIVGRQVLINGEGHTVVGVMPRGFGFPVTDHLWTPIALDLAAHSRGDHAYIGVARLRPGVTLAEAQAELDAVARGLATAYPKEAAGWRASAASMRDDMMREMRPVLAIFQTATLLVLVVACVNAANVLYARAASREHELAVRGALGAGRRQLARLLLAESLLLGLTAGAVALLLAAWGVRIFSAAVPAERPFWLDFSLDWRVFAYGLGAALLAGGLAGLAPSLRASGGAVRARLGDGTRSAGAGVRVSRGRSALVAVQLALALLLTIGSALFAKSLVALASVSPGFDPAGLLTMRLVPRGGAYETRAGRDALAARLVERAAALPGVRGAAAAEQLPLRGGNFTRVVADGASGDRPTDAMWNAVTPEYFAAMRIPVVEGRAFTAAEWRDSAVAVIDARLAQALWPGRSPLGRRLRFGPAEAPRWLSVVGVVGGVKQFGLDDDRVAQLHVPLGSVPPGQGFSIVARVDGGEPAALAPALRRVLRDEAPSIGAVDVTPMPTIVRDVHWQPKVFGALFGAFGVAALLLAVVGVYGMTAYAVTQRTREIGVRVAMGATPRDVVRLTARRGLWLTAAGMAAGLALTLAAGGVFRRVLFGVEPTDPAVLVAAPLFLTAVTMLATWLPARRAARVDPAVALRAE